MKCSSDQRSGPVLVGALGLVAYTYLGYPLLAAGRAALRPRPHATGPTADRVSVIIAAHDEVEVIGPKLDTLFADIGDRTGVEVIVVDDGSTDGTADAAEASGWPVRVLRLPRTGKAGALNAAVEASSGDILAFTDANSMFAPGALDALLAPFADAAVGGVAGDQRYEGDAGSVGERTHWSFDRLLKRAETIAGSTVSATGALYAIRRRHFEPVPEGVTDDFFVSTGVVVGGDRLVFAEGAAVIERAADTPAREYGRKVRVMTRGLRAVVLRRQLLSPRHGFYAVALLSRKVLRRLAAVPLLVAFASALLRPRRSRLAALVASIGSGVGLLGAAGLAGPPDVRRHPLFALPAFVCLSVAAALRALWNTAAGVTITQWETPGSGRGKPSA